MDNPCALFWEGWLPSMLVPQGEPAYLRAEAPTCSDSELLNGTWLASVGISDTSFSYKAHPAFTNSTWCLVCYD
ncbi:hypothetical protein Y032_0100g3315 [Ancylostoma ceylanicum]|uniref:Uncharacterized protein n=1 Tax=Ancylostoma ceylanicum TaxID=53326 RepID=A0A016TIP5_9BILA|nr:hypothetical protein Y032_0100g3315 [Ancylostoma ceylanicum]